MFGPQLINCLGTIKRYVLVRVGMSLRNGSEVSKVHTWPGLSVCVCLSLNLPVNQDAELAVTAPMPWLSASHND